MVMNGAVVRKKVERAVIENIPDLSAAACENEKSDPPPPLLSPVTSSSSSRTTAHSQHGHSLKAPVLQRECSPTNGASGSSWTCNVCRDIFLDRVQLEAHSSEAHGDAFPSECPLCHCRFVTGKELGAHIKQSHLLGPRPAKANVSGAGTDGNSNSIVLTSHNTNKPKANPANSSASAADDPKVEPLRIQTNVLNSATATARPNPPLKTYSKESKAPPRSNPGASGSIVVPISGPGSYSGPGVHCHRCGRNFVDSETWTYHVVNYHIRNRNPYPIVSMNYVDKRTLRRNSTTSSCNDEKNLQVTHVTAGANAEAQPQPPDQSQPKAAPKEELKLKIAVCRRGSDSSERKSYTILKRPSLPEPEDQFPVLVPIPASPPSVSAIDNAEPDDKEADATTPIAKESESGKSASAISANCSSEGRHGEAGPPPSKPARTDSTELQETAIAADQLPTKAPPSKDEVKTWRGREEPAETATEESKTCPTNVAANSTAFSEKPLHDSAYDQVKVKVISATDNSLNSPPSPSVAKPKSGDKDEAVDQRQQTPPPPSAPRGNEVSTIRKVPPSTARERSGSSSESDSEKRKGKDLVSSSAKGIIKEIISSSSPKPLLRPITIGSMSIIPTDYSPEAESDSGRSHSHGRGSLTTETASTSTSTTIIQEPENDGDDEEADPQPESILPLTEDDLERRSARVISEESSIGVTVVDIQPTTSAAVATISSIEGRSVDPSLGGSGMLAKKKQFITAMIEDEIREHRHSDPDRMCNGNGNGDNGNDGATDLSLSSRERNNHKCTNTSPETSRPSSGSFPTALAPPQFENITPPNSEEAQHGEGDGERDESENVVIDVRPEDLSLDTNGDDRNLRDRERQVDDQAHAEEVRILDGHAQGHEGEVDHVHEYEPEKQNDSDDFKCTMCDKIFTSDTELHAHFNEAHLRIGSTLSNSNIFEPESPYPVQQNERETGLDIYGAESCFASQEAQRLVEMERQRAAHAIESQRRLSAEILSQTLTRGAHVGNHSQFRNSSAASASAAPTLLQQQMLRPQGLARSQSYGTSFLQQGTGPLSRPHLPAATGSRFSTPQNANPRLAAALQQLQSRQSVGTGAYPTPQTVSNLRNLRHSQAQFQQTQRQYQLLQQQSQVSRATSGSLQRSLSLEVSSGGRTVPTNLTNETYPSALQQHLQGQQQTHSQLNLNSVQQQQQERRAHAYNWNPPRVPENQNQVQNLLHSKRMAEAQGGSAAKQARLDGHLRSQSHSHLNPQQQQQSQQSQLAMAAASRQQPLTHAHSQMEVRSAQVPLRSSPPAPDHAREVTNNAGLSNVRLGNAITLSVCPTTEASGSVNNESNRQQDIYSPSANANALNSFYGNSSPLNLNSAQLNPDSVAVALANRGVTVTPAVTDQIPGPRRSPVNISISNATPTDLRHSPRTHSPISPSGAVNMNRMQMQSPPIQGPQHSPTHQFAVPRGPAPRILYTTATVNSAIERPDRPPTVDLTEDEIYANQQTLARENSAAAARMQQQQMQMLAARQAQVQAQAAQAQAAQAQASAGQVNLTQGGDGGGGQGGQSQGSGGSRVSGSRAAFACNLCGVLYPSVQHREEHKMNQHGIPPGQLQLQQQQQQSQQQQQQRVGPVSITGAGIPQRVLQNPVGMNGPGRPPGPRQIQAHQQQISPPSTQPQVSPRPATTTRTAQQPTNNRYLYIPLIDMTRMDSSRLRSLEELGILSMMPLHGNERTGSQMGIPVLSLRPEVGNQHLPWDSLLPVGPVTGMAALANAPVARGGGGQQQQLNGQGQQMGTIHHHHQR